MTHFSIRLRKILLYDYLYYSILIIAILFSLYISNKEIKCDYNINDKEFNTIITNYKIDGDKLSLSLKNNLQATYYINSKEEQEYLLNNIKYGAHININGILTEPINNTIPNTFNYKKYLKHKGIKYILNIDKYNITPPTNILYKIKNWIVTRINKSKNKDYLLTFIIGDKKLIDDNSYKNYQINGVTHLFAISGMHIGLFASILSFILKKLKINDNKILIIIDIVLILYGLLTSFPASIKRAGLFYILLSFNKIYYTHIKTINILLLTGSILLFINPHIIYDIGFQYSFTTSFGLIYATKYIKGNYILSLQKVSAIAFIFSLPITLSNFYEVNLLTIINNIIYVPFVSVIIYPLSLLVFIFPFLDIILSICITILEFINNNLSKISLVINIGITNIYYIILYYIILLIALYKNKKLLILIFIELLFIKYISLFDSNAYIYFLDIGQGDSIVLVAPYKKEVIMIDTGGILTYKKEEWATRNKEYNLSDNTISFLKSLNINHIDHLIITHGDNDHCGETIHLIEKYNIKSIELNDGDYNYLELLILNKNIDNDYQYKYFDLKKLNYKLYDNENDNSLYYLLNIYNTKVLFTGDGSKKNEIDIMNKYHLNVDILKLGHHGSKTSSDYNFLKSLNLSLGIISSGRNNKFKHPSKETIENLNNLNIKYLNTQTNGTIKFKINKKTYTYFTYEP